MLHHNFSILSVGLRPVWLLTTKHISMLMLSFHCKEKTGNLVKRPCMELAQYGAYGVGNITTIIDETKP